MRPTSPAEQIVAASEPPLISVPLISVIVPIYDVQDHVAACIASLRAQTHPAIEVLMIDDGSTDDSAARALEAAGDDPRFQLISQDNAGLSAARNRGLDAARGAYIAFVDSDDRVCPDFLAALLEALDAYPQAPWAACAIRNRFADQTNNLHSAIYDIADPALAPGCQLFHFRSAPDIIRHFPSAWNKLYRRDFIGDLRFPEGTWFEDHAFYLTLALRTDCILHLADPLYEQTRGRPGQITETDSDRVFEQLSVLDDIVPLLTQSPLPDGAAAAATLANRLLSERSTALSAPARRARFAQEARAALTACGIEYRPDPAQGISASWGLELDGILPLSVIVPWDGQDAGPLTATLTALRHQRGPGFELLILCDSAAHVARATQMVQALSPEGGGGWAKVLRNTGANTGTAQAAGLDQAQGRFVAWIDAGDLPDPWALYDRVEALLANGAGFSISARRYGPAVTDPGDPAGVATHAGFTTYATHAGFDPDYVPANTNAPAVFAATPHQALAADLALSAMMFERALLDSHTLQPAPCGRHGGWPLILGALLLAEKAVYLPRPDVTIHPDAAARGGLSRPYPLARLARDHARLCAALPATAAKALPLGWERRLLARALRIWLLEGPARSRPGQAIAQLSAAALIARRGMGRTGQFWPAGFDPQIGPKFARLFDSAGLLRLALPRERARLTADGILPGEARAAPLALRDLHAARRIHSFAMSQSDVGQARFLVNFDHAPVAGISFYAGDGKTVPLHVSLRADTGLDPDQGTGEIVINDTRTDGLWRKERHRAYDLPQGDTELTLEITPTKGDAAIRLWLNDTLVWTLGSRSLSRRDGLRHLDQITHLTLDGAVTPLELRPDAAPRALALDGRLHIRLPGPPPPGATLTIDGSETDFEALHLDGAGAQTLLPARAWGEVAPEGARVGAPEGARVGVPEGALVLRYARPDQPDQTLALTRTDLAARIGSLLRHGLPMGDADLILNIIEQVALADLTPYLDSGAQAELARLTQRFGLEDVLPGLVRAPRHHAEPFGPMMIDLAARARRSDQISTLLDDLPPDPAAARHLARLLVERATQDRQMEDLFEAVRTAGLLPLPLDADDMWTLSSSLPFLWLEGREADLLDSLHQITKPGPGWRVTPALAWIGTRAQAGDPAISPEGRRAVLDMLLEWLARESQDYWGRSACRALTAWAAGLVPDLARLPAPLEQSALTTMITAYGLSRAFWAQLAIQTDAAFPPRLALARDAFAVLVSDADLAQKAAALTRLQQLGVGDIARARVEYLGPAGVAVARDKALTPADLLPLAELNLNATPPDTMPPDATPPDIMGLAALRHMATPCTAPAGPDTADLVARTLRSMTPEQDGDQYGALRRAVHQQITALLASAGAEQDNLPTLLANLERLSFEDARYLGLGLAMTLLTALPDAAIRRILADWLIAQDSPRQADPRRRAPAVRMGLVRLSTSELPEAAEVYAHYTSPTSGLTAGKTRPLPVLPSGDSPLPAPNPLNDVIVTVFSCHPYLETRIPALRAGWLRDLEAMGIPYVFVLGNGDGTLAGDILHVDAPDDYEGLPAKTLATIDWVRRNTTHTHLFKIDDDCLVDADNLFGDLAYRSCDYMGRKLHRAPGQMDRIWHQAKASSPRGKLELDKSPEPSTYADGGSGYLLSRDAMEAACTAAQSPAGRALIQTSFMEDKLLGDLLHLGGIALSTPGYLTSIRRRTFSEATPVAFWNVGFYPSRAAPTQQVHLDTHLGHDAVRALRGTSQLAPRKIWPSFQPPKLGNQSNALELLSSEDSVARARAAEVAVVAVMRNERFMLPQFLAHYRRLGVTSFLIADNVSDDGTREYLLEQDDVALFSVDTDYRLSQYGVAWQQAMMAAFRVGRWSLVADADELLVWQQKQTQTLPDLLQTPDFAEAEAARIFMLDMYPEGPLSDATFTQADPFTQAGFADRVPFTENPLTRGPFSDQTLWTSALRHRLIPGTRPDLFAAQKIALLKYQPWMRLSAGLHFVTGPRRAAQDLFFGHFKYNADFYRKAQAEVTRKQHFNDAEEYRKYLALASEGRAVIFDPDLSLPWHEVPFVRARLAP